MNDKNQLDTLGDRIREARGDLPREKVAVAIGKSRSTLVNWEKNNNTPRSKDLQALADYLNVRHRWLLTGKGPMRLTSRDLEAAMRLVNSSTVTEIGRQDLDSNIRFGHVRDDPFFNAQSMEESLKRLTIDASNMLPGETRSRLLKIGSEYSDVPKYYIRLTAERISVEEFMNGDNK